MTHSFHEPAAGEPSDAGDSYRRRGTDGFPVGTRPCLVAVASRLDKRALAWKCRTPELRQVGAAPHVRLDQLAFAIFKVTHPVHQSIMNYGTCHAYLSAVLRSQADDARHAGTRVLRPHTLNIHVSWHTVPLHSWPEPHADPDCVMRQVQTIVAPDAAGATYRAQAGENQQRCFRGCYAADRDAAAGAEPAGRRH